MSGKLLIQIRTDVDWRSGSYSVRPLLPGNTSVIMPSMTGQGSGNEGIHTKREDSNVYS